MFHCVRDVAHELGVRTSDHKFEVGTSDGRVGTFVTADPTATPPVVVHEQVGVDAAGAAQGWAFAGSAAEPRYIVVLGKEFRLTEGRVGDTTARLDHIERLTDSMLALSTRTTFGVQLVDHSALESILGNWCYVVQTAAGLRGTLNWPLRCLRARNGLGPQRQPRAPPSADAVAQGWRRRTGAWFTYCGVSQRAVFALRELVTRARACRGHAFIGRRRTMAERVVFIMQDAAGSAEDWEAQGADFLLRGAGAWFAWHGMAEIPHAYQRWAADDLRAFPNVSSSGFEAAGSNSHVELALERFPGATMVVEVLDNAGWVSVARSLACRSEELTAYADRRGTLIRTAVDAGVLFYVLHTPRAQGDAQDGVSKTELVESDGRTGLQRAVELLLQRLPSLSLATIAWTPPTAAIFPVRRARLPLRFAAVLDHTQDVRLCDTAAAKGFRAHLAPARASLVAEFLRPSAPAASPVLVDTGHTAADGTAERSAISAESRQRALAISLRDWHT